MSKTTQCHLYKQPALDLYIPTYRYILSNSIGLHKHTHLTKNINRCMFNINSKSHDILF